LESEARSPGYSNGPLYAGEFLFELFGGTNDSAVWETYLTGFSGFENAIDGRFGEGKYQQIIDGDFPAVIPEMIPQIDLERYSKTYDKHMELVSLYRLSRLVEPPRRSEIYGRMAIDFPDGRRVRDLSFVEGDGVLIGLQERYATYSFFLGLELLRIASRKTVFMKRSFLFLRK